MATANRDTQSSCNPAEEFRAPASLTSVRELRRYIYDAGRSQGVPARVLDQFATALCELANNAVSHPEPSATELRLELMANEDGVVADFRTDACSFADRQQLFTSARPCGEMHADTPRGRGLYITLCLFPFLDYAPRPEGARGYEQYLLMWDRKRQIDGRTAAPGPS